MISKGYTSSWYDSENGDDDNRSNRSLPPPLPREPVIFQEGRDLAIPRQPSIHSISVSVPNDKDDNSDNSHYPTGFSLIILIVALCLSMFLIALDQTILATAIPKITDDFNTVADIGWYGSAYFLTTTSIQPMFGRIYKIFNIKRTFLVSIGVFELGSLICAVANSSVMLIIGRAIAGIGVSGIISGSTVITAFTLPLPKRPLVFGIIGGVWGLSSILGPILGGALTDHLSWRWCFYINLPIGAFAAAVVIFVLKPQHQMKNTDNLPLLEKILQLDLLGSAILIPGVSALLLALQWGGSLYPWYEARIVALFLGFACSAALFVITQIDRGELATIPPRIVKQRTVAASLVYSCFLLGGIFTLTYFLPIYFQTITGASATRSGLETLPRLISSLVATVVGGAIVSRIGHYIHLLFLGTALTCVGSGLFTTLSVRTPFSHVLAFQIVLGIGSGLVLQIPIVAVQAVLPLEDVSIGTSCVMFTQAVGGAVFVSVGQSVFANGMVYGMRKFAPQVDPRKLLAAGATEIRSVLAGLGLASELPGVLEAYMLGLRHCFIVILACSILAFCAALVFEWKSVKGDGEKGKERENEKGKSAEMAHIG